MHVEIAGSGRSVLLLHGGGVSSWMWRPLRAQLDRDAIRTIVPDLPGHGRSAALPYVSHRDTADRLIRIIREAAPAGVIVLGFSLGAQLALQLAAEHPELVQAAVIVSAEVIPPPLPRTTLALLHWTAPLARQAWFARLQARQLAIPEELLPDYLADSLAMTRDTLLASVGDNIRFTLPNAWRDFPGPAAVLVGARERRLMLDSARTIHGALPSSELVVVPDAAHDIPLTAPDQLAARIRSLASLA